MNFAIHFVRPNEMLGACKVRAPRFMLLIVGLSAVIANCSKPEMVVVSAILNLWKQHPNQIRKA